jgi:ribosomal protein L18E
MGKRGRPPVLDDKKRAQIVAILAVGCSQSVAAQYVGCAVRTIQNTAERDPKFAEELGKARSNAELGLVKNIRNAAKKEQYWRAAAWALERGFPEKYARRGPDVITVEQIGLLLTKFSAIIVQDLPEPGRKDILKKMEMVARSLGITLKWKDADESL